MKRISIIGSGNVGTNTAFFIAERRATGDAQKPLDTCGPDFNF